MTWNYQSLLSFRRKNKSPQLQVKSSKNSNLFSWQHIQSGRDDPYGGTTKYAEIAHECAWWKFSGTFTLNITQPLMLNFLPKMQGKLVHWYASCLACHRPGFKSCQRQSIIKLVPSSELELWSISWNIVKALKPWLHVCSFVLIQHKKS